MHQLFSLHSRVWECVQPSSQALSAEGEHQLGMRLVTGTGGLQSELFYCIVERGFIKSLSMHYVGQHTAWIDDELHASFIIQWASNVNFKDIPKLI